MAVQLMLFESNDEIDILRREVTQIRASNEKTRKALFGRHGHLSNLYVELDKRLNIIERNICK